MSGCWVETYVARQRGAKAHLEGCGFYVQRHSRTDEIATWHVSTFTGTLTTEELIDLAIRFGFEREKAA